jgi:hypothetical protein
MTPSLESEYRTIPLTRGFVATVDADNFERLNQHKWYAIWMPGTQSFYASRHAPMVKGYRGVFWMHREVLGLMPGDPRKGDHKRSGDTLNNTRENLRIATNSQNRFNARKQSNNKSGYTGVWLARATGKYGASIKADGKRKFLGWYSSAEEARTVRDYEALILHGEFAFTSEHCVSPIVVG